MKKIFWILLFTLSQVLASSTLEIYLKQAEVGDYIVAKIDKTVTVVRVHSFNDSMITLEEISVPQRKRPSYSLKEWLSKKAPGHTSWSLTQIDLKKGGIVSCYSLSKGCQIQLDEKESLLATLLRLKLTPARPENIRKIGPPPLDGERDLRKNWTPPFTFEGKTVEKASFDIFETTWPKDGSDLEESHLTLYFDHAKRIPLPVWIEWAGSYMQASIQIIDSGKNLFPSNHQAISTGKSK